MNLDRLASVQFGVVSRDQLKHRLKWSRGAARWAVECGELIPFVGATFRVPGVKPAWHQRAMAATLLGGQASALSHDTAAALWNIGGYKKRGEVHVLLPGTNLKSLGEGIAQHNSRRPFSVTEREGLRVTSLARTLLDVAPRLTDRQLEAALDDVQKGNPTLEKQLDAELDATERRAVHGAGRLARLLEQRRRH